MNYTIMKFPWNQGDSPTKFFERSFTNSDLNIINYFLYLQNKYLTIYVSQQTIAKDIGINRKTVQRTLEKLEHHNLITRLNRGPKKTCLYEISKIFMIPEVRWQLSSRFTALRKLCIAFLLSSFSSQLANVPELVNNNLLNLKRSDRYSYRDSLLLFKESKANKKKRCWKRNGSAMYEAKGEDPSVLFNAFTPALENFKSLKLTPAGKVHLCIFPDEVIKIADKRLSQRAATQDPMGYIFKTCIKICQEKNYKLAHRLRDCYIRTKGIKYSDNAEFYEKSSYTPAKNPPSPLKKFDNNKDNSRFNANHAGFKESERIKTYDGNGYEQELCKLKAQLANLDKNNMFALLGKGYIENRIAHIEAELMKLKGEQCSSIPSQETPLH